MASADIEYRVLVTYASGGTLLGDLDKAHGHATKLGHSLHQSVDAARELGGELVHGFQHAVEHAAHLAGHLAKMGLAAGIGAAAYGVGHLNNELEQTQISLAAIFKAQGFSRTFDQAFSSAGNQMSKMKQDIKTLPGDLGQLSNVMLQLASPLANAGKGPDAIREMAGKTMLASQILLGAKYGAGAQEIGAREMTMLLQGNMSSRNSFAQELPGMQQYKAGWKGMSEEQRLKIVSAKIDSLVKDAGGKFATSFVAGFTTLKDNIKYGFLAPATMPLFGAVKKTIADINGWFDANKAKVTGWAEYVGNELKRAWDRGIETAEEWWPQILSFAKQLRMELEVVWQRFGPAVEHAATALKEALGNGTATKEIKKVLELYAATKIGGAAMSPIGSGAKMLGGLGQLAGAGVLDAGAITAGAVAIGVLSVAALGAAGELHALADSTSKNHEAAKTAATELSGAWDRLTAQLNVSIMPALESFGIGLTRFAAWMIDPKSIDWGALVDPSGNKDADAHAKAQFAAHDNNISSPMRQLGTEAGREFVNAIRTPVISAGGGKSIQEQYKEMYAAKAKKGAGAGVGMHVQKVEIVVNSNQDSGRVAEMVVDKLQHLNRHPKLSPHVPNYSK